MVQLPELLLPTQHRQGVKAGDNYALWNTPALTGEQFNGLNPADRLLYLALLGSLAPSTHNTQPWAFKIEERANSLQVFLDRDRVLPASDANGRQSCLSVGCAIGSLTTAAESYGLNPKVTIAEMTPDDVKPYDKSKNNARNIPVATIVLPQSSNKTTAVREIQDAIFSRRMDRGRYVANREIPLEVIDRIKDFSSKQRVFLNLIIRGGLSGNLISAIAEAQYLADNTVANSRHFSKELGEWFLLNDSPSGFGMPGDTFLQDDGNTANVRAQLRGETPLKADSIAGFASAGKLGIQSSPLMGVLTVSKDAPAHWVKAGIALDKIATHLEQRNIRMAIHAGLAEVAMVRNFLPGAIFSGRSPVILFRAGYSNEELKPHSPRLPITETLFS